MLTHIGFCVTVGPQYISLHLSRRLHDTLNCQPILHSINYLDPVFAYIHVMTN